MGTDSGAIGSLNVLRIQSDTYFALEKKCPTCSSYTKRFLTLELHDASVEIDPIKDIASEEASLHEVGREFLNRNIWEQEAVEMK